MVVSGQVSNLVSIRSELRTSATGRRITSLGLHFSFGKDGYERGSRSLRGLPNGVGLW